MCGAREVILEGTFVSEWDGDIVLRTPAELNCETGEVCLTEPAHDIDGLETLDGEYFVPNANENEEIPICPECHEYILKTSMEPDEHISHQLNEVKKCTNPDCDYEYYV